MGFSTISLSFPGELRGICSPETGQRLEELVELQWLWQVLLKTCGERAAGIVPRGEAGYGNRRDAPSFVGVEQADALDQREPAFLRRADVAGQNDRPTPAKPSQRLRRRGRRGHLRASTGQELLDELARIGLVIDEEHVKPHEIWRGVKRRRLMKRGLRLRRRRGQRERQRSPLSRTAALRTNGALV